MKKGNKENIDNKNTDSKSKTTTSSRGVVNIRKLRGKLPPSVNKNRNIIIYSFIAIAFLFAMYGFSLTGNTTSKSVPISILVNDIKSGDFSKVTVVGNDVTGYYKKSQGTYTTEDATISSGTNIVTLFSTNGINVSGNNPTIYLEDAVNYHLSSILSILLTVMLIVGLFIFFRQMNKGGAGVFSFGESKARILFGKRQDVTFASVAGADEAKKELEEVVEFLRNPKKFISMGARIPRGVLLSGPPGTGKTLLAKAVSGEAGVRFFSVSGSEFEEMLVGAGASRVRDLFMKARKIAPSLIFIDEIDAIGRKRGTVLNSGHTEQTLNQILVEMDGFDSTTNVIVIAATNRPDVLDPALLRPGRFDRLVTLNYPDTKGRIEILKVHSKNKPLDNDVNFDALAKRTAGFTGADLENMLNEGAIIAAMANRKTITDADLEEAAVKVTMGSARNSYVSDEEKKTIAYHEAGHAVVSKFLPNSDPVHKIEIKPRGSAGGVTIYLPQKDSQLETKSRFLTSLIHMLGGYASEKLVFGEVTNGASNDIEKATSLARSMVMRYGMSDVLGPVKYGNKSDFDDTVGLYGESSKAYSGKTGYKIDEEVQKLVTFAFEKAYSILSDARNKLDRVAEELLKNEVLTHDEFEKLMNE